LAPQGALDQLGHALSRIIHAFAKAKEGDKIFMAKWDIKDGFWRMYCAEGEEYNFAYVLPQEEGKPVTLVVPTTLQMGWVESQATSRGWQKYLEPLATIHSACGSGPLHTGCSFPKEN
jgi:hypothetical protein